MLLPKALKMRAIKGTMRLGLVLRQNIAKLIGHALVGESVEGRQTTTRPVW